ncbi:DNA polymerase [Bacillus cereus]|nr:DNA polymerase [Bacillus cereus]
MLKGHIKYDGMHYNAYGLDTSSSINLTLANPITTSMRYLDPDNEQLAYSEKRIQIKGTTMSIESERSPDGKRYKPNMDFFGRLGVLMRYIKNNCRNINNTLKLVGDVFDPKVTTQHEVEVGDYTAWVELSYSNITKFVFEGYGFDIKLFEQEQTGYVDAYYTTKENVQAKFKNDDLFNFFGIKEKEKKILDFGNINDMDSPFYETIEQIMEANPDRDFSWLLGRKYIIVNDDNLEETINYLSQFQVLSMDTETTGLKITFKSRTNEHDECVGIILTGKEGESFYFPMKHTKIPNLCGGDDWYFMETYMKPLLEKKDIIVHNASFDWKVIYIYGIVTNVFIDTMAVFELTLKAKYDTKVGLKDLVALLLKRDSLELDDLCKSGSFKTVDQTFADLPPELVRLYACADADNTLALYNYIRETNMLENWGATKVVQFESIFACVIGYSEFHGQFVNVSETDNLVQDIEQDLKASDKKMRDELRKVGYDADAFNPQSNTEKLKIIYEVFGAPEQFKQGDKLTADKNALKRLSKMTNADDTPKYPFVNYFQEFNEVNTLRKNFTKNLPDLCTSDGFMFSSVKQFLKTGRVSITKPNYQSYNDTVKKYIKPRPGFWMGDMDYSSIEYRVIASMSGQMSLVEAFKDPNTDYHKLQASNMYQVPYELVSKAMRGEAKAFNFGIPFGMGNEKLGATIFGKISTENTRKATALRERYFKGQDNVREFFVRAQSDAVKYGYTETHFGRRRYYDKQTTSVGSIKRQGGNQRIQGTAADIYKQAVVRLFLRIINEGWLDKVLLPGFIHDELLMEVSMEIHPLDWMKVLKEEMELKIDGFCPLYIGFGVGRSWYEAKSVEIPTELQEEIQGKTSEFNWNGNLSEFCEWVPNRINQFELDYSDKYLLNKENQGQVISAVTYDYINSQVNRVQDELMKNYLSQLQPNNRYDFDVNVLSVIKHRADKLVPPSKTHEITLDEKVTAYCKKLKVDKQWTVNEKPKDMVLADFDNLQVLLDFYCQYRGIDRAEVKLLAPNDVDVQKEQAKQAMNENEKDYYYNSREDEENNKNLFIKKIQDYGCHLNVEEKKAYFRYDQHIMNLIKPRVHQEKKGYQVVFVDLKEDKQMITNAYISSANLNLAQREVMLAIA